MTKNISLYGHLLKKARTRVHCVQCNNCGDIIYSRTRHDYHYCRCGWTSIDGGFDYQKVGWTEGEPPRSLIKYVNATREGLYNDWNWQENNYGIIGVQGWKTRGLLKTISKKD